MKKARTFILLLIGISIFFAPTAMAKNNNNGISYYHESMGYIPRTNDQVVTDMALVSHNFNSVKLYYNPYRPDDAYHAAQAVEIAKLNNLDVVWTENNDSETLTEENWPDYVDKVMSDCLLADSLNVDTFIVGNEISIHNNGSSGFDDTNLPIKIKELVASCQEATSMNVSYQDGWWKKDAWNGAGLGNLPFIYFTLYENDADFESHAIDIYSKFGKQGIIGEWSTQGTFAQVAANEVEWFLKIKDRKKTLEKIGLQHYYFTFRDTGVDNNQKGFGLWRSDRLTPHLAWFLF